MKKKNYKPINIILFSAIILLLTNISNATTTVEDLYEQGERINHEVIELNNRVDGLQTGFDDAVASIGLRIIVIVILLYTFLYSTTYILRVFWNWRSRVRMRKRREWLVGSLKKEISLLKAKNYAIEKDLDLIVKSHNAMLSIMKNKPKERPLNIFITQMMLAVTITMFSYLAIFTFPIVPTFENMGISPVTFVPSLIGIVMLIIISKNYSKEKKLIRMAEDVNMKAEVINMSKEHVDIPDNEDFTEKVDDSTKKKIDIIKKLKMDLGADPDDYIEQATKTEEPQQELSDAETDILEAIRENRKMTASHIRRSVKSLKGYNKRAFKWTMEKLKERGLISLMHEADGTEFWVVN